MSVSGPDVTSQLVTLNTAGGDAIYAHRMSVYHDSTGAASRSGRNIFATPGEHGKNSAMNIRPFELAFVHANATADMAERRSSNRLDDVLPHIFTTFNLIEKAKESEFRRSLCPLGFTVAYTTFGEVAQADDGLAAAVSGSLTTQNTGLNYFAPGMLIKWSPPPMDPASSDPLDAKTREFVRNRALNGAVSSDMPRDRFPAVLSPFNPDRDLKEAISRKMVAALQRVKAQIATPGAPQYSLDADNDDDVVSFREHFLSTLLTIYAYNEFKTTRPDVDMDAAVRGVATTQKFVGVDLNDMSSLAAFLYRGYDVDIDRMVPPTEDTTLRRLQMEGRSNTLFLELKTLHDATRQVVAKAIGFSAPGGRLDLAV